MKPHNIPKRIFCSSFFGKLLTPLLMFSLFMQSCGTTEALANMRQEPIAVDHINFQNPGSNLELDESDNHEPFSHIPANRVSKKNITGTAPKISCCNPLGIIGWTLFGFASIGLVVTGVLQQEKINDQAAQIAAYDRSLHGYIATQRMLTGIDKFRFLISETYIPGCLGNLNGYADPITGVQYYGYESIVKGNSTIIPGGMVVGGYNASTVISPTGLATQYEAIANNETSCTYAYNTCQSNLSEAVQANTSCQAALAYKTNESEAMYRQAVANNETAMACQTNLTQCQHSLNTYQTNLSTAQNASATCQTNLLAAQNANTTCQGYLTGNRTGWASTNSSLTVCNNQLSGLESVFYSTNDQVLAFYNCCINNNTNSGVPTAQVNGYCHAYYQLTAPSNPYLVRANYSTCESVVFNSPSAQSILSPCCLNGTLSGTCSNSDILLFVNPPSNGGTIINGIVPCANAGGGTFYLPGL